jgi:NAD+ diphosphatase
MLGFHAEYLAGEVKADGVEVVEAGWFHYKNLPKVPGSVSISGWLIESYLRQLQQ